MVSGVILTSVVAAYLSVRVFLVARSKSSTNVASMPGGEGESSEATPAVVQNVPFLRHSKLKEICRVTRSVFNECGVIMKSRHVW